MPGADETGPGDALSLTCHQRAHKRQSNLTRAATMDDTDRLIREWEASGNMAKMVAAGIARKIASGMHRYEEFPPNSALAGEWDVSERTVSTAKRILGDHGILILENRRYYVALSRQA